MSDATQFLNLDDLPTTVDRKVQLDGTEHQMQLLSVEGFIKQQKMLKAFEARPIEERATGDDLSLMVDMIVMVFPSMTVEQLRKLPMTKLNALITFISAKTDDLVAAAQAAQKDEGTGETEGSADPGK